MMGVGSCGAVIAVEVTGSASGLKGLSGSAEGRFVVLFGGPLSSGSLMLTSFQSGITVSMFSSGRSPPFRSRVLWSSVHVLGCLSRIVCNFFSAAAFMSRSFNLSISATFTLKTFPIVISSGSM